MLGGRRAVHEQFGQYLRANRPGRAGGAGLQERDSDRRIREATNREGQTRFAATKEASRLRLRPIVMTSLAFILGVVPLVVAKGAGAEMRRSLGTAVFSGMLGVTTIRHLSDAGILLCHSGLQRKPVDFGADDAPVGDAPVRRSRRKCRRLVAGRTWRRGLSLGAGRGGSRRVFGIGRDGIRVAAPVCASAVPGNGGR